MIGSRKLLSRRKGRHAPCLAQLLVCVQRHLWDMIRSRGRGGVRGTHPITPTAQHGRTLEAGDEQGEHLMVLKIR